MRFLVVGAGAIGTYVGGSLALAGQPVTFLVREASAASLASGGLHLQIGEKSAEVPHPALATDLAGALEGNPFDAVILAVKSFDTPRILEAMRPVCERMPAVLCLQNGVENEAALAAVLGEERVLPGTVTSSVARLGPGSIRLERLRGVGIAGEGRLARELAGAFDAAGLRARLYPDGRSMKWSKMLTNLVANASSAILDLSPAEILAVPGLFRLEIDQLREALDVMRRLGIPVVDLPGTPVRLLAAAARYLPYPASQPLLRRALAGGRGGKMPSFHIDLRSGRGQTEVDALNGAVVRFAREAGAPAPLNRLLNETLGAMARGEMASDRFARRPAEWIAFVGESLKRA